MPGTFVDLTLQRGDARLHLGGDGGERLTVDEDAHPLHGGEDRDERQLQLVVEVKEPLAASCLESTARTGSTSPTQRP